MDMTNIETADAIIKAYEAGSKDVSMQKQCLSVEGRFSAEDEDDYISDYQKLGEEALSDCRHALAKLSPDMRETLLSQYMGLQGYYRRKINPKQRCRARGQIPFDNVLWQRDVTVALLSFLNNLKKASGQNYNRRFIEALNIK